MSRIKLASFHFAQTRDAFPWILLHSLTGVKGDQKGKNTIWTGLAGKGISGMEYKKNNALHSISGYTAIVHRITIVISCKSTV